MVYEIWGGPLAYLLGLSMDVGVPEIVAKDDGVRRRGLVLVLGEEAGVDGALVHEELAAALPRLLPVVQPVVHEDALERRLRGRRRPVVEEVLALAARTLRGALRLVQRRRRVR